MKNARIWAAAALVLLGACSDGLTKDEYIKQADRICAQADSKTEDLDPPKRPAELETFVDEAERITGQLLADLRELEPPEEDRNIIREMLSKIEEAMGYLPGIEEAARERDTKALGAIAKKLQDAASEANRLARDYGLKRCGQSQPASVP